MGFINIFCYVYCNVVVSLMRNMIPSRINYYTTCCDCYFSNFSRSDTKTFVYDVSKELSVFVGLIITKYYG